jgi:two-component system LytT family response regulator
VITERIRTLVVDDEPLARSSLRVLLSADAEIDLLGECATGRAALDVLQRTPADLVFLDVQMPGLDGFEVLRNLDASAAPAVVFVTAFDDYALQAFDVGAVHYLLKPFDDARFAAVLQRAKEHVRGRRLQSAARRLAELCAAPANEPAHLTRLTVKESGRIHLIPVEQIDWIEAEDYYVQIHAGGRSHLLRQSLRELEAQLDPRRFLRIHRSTLVNVDRIKALEPHDHGECWVLLDNGRRFKLSRTHRDRLEALDLCARRSPRG